MQTKKLGPIFNFELGPFFTLQPPNLGPIFDFAPYIYIHIYAGER